MQEGTRQGMGKGRGASMSSPRALPSKYLHAFTSQEVLWAPLVVRIFTQAVLHWHDWSDHWSLVINSMSSPSSFPEARRTGSGERCWGENSNPLILPGSFWWPALTLTLSRDPNHQSSNQHTKDTLILHIPKVTCCGLSRSELPTQPGTASLFHLNLNCGS